MRSPASRIRIWAHAALSRHSETLARQGVAPRHVGDRPPSGRKVMNGRRVRRGQTGDGQRRQWQMRVESGNEEALAPRLSDGLLRGLCRCRESARGADSPASGAQ
jgi:hypothetical protein